MATQILKEEPACTKCGADVRENTAFCYKCGTPVSSPAEQQVEPEITAAPAIDEKTQAALDDLAQRLTEDAKNDEQLAKAASERRRARVAQKKPKPVRWEPDNGGPGIGLIAVTLMVAIIAVVIVYLTAIAK